MHCFCNLKSQEDWLKQVIAICYHSSVSPKFKKFQRKIQKQMKSCYSGFHFIVNNVCLLHNNVLIFKGKKQRDIQCVCGYHERRSDNSKPQPFI